jgi:hypothetical protein
MPNDEFSDPAKLKKAVVNLFKNYEKYSTRQDIVKIADAWALPGMVIAKNSRRVFEQRETFFALIREMLEHADSQGIQIIKKDVRQIGILFPNVFKVITRDTGLDGEGNPVVSWDQLYIVQNFEVWHKRLGHLPKKVFKYLHDKDIQKLHYDDDGIFCYDFCYFGE